MVQIYGMDGRLIREIQTAGEHTLLEGLSDGIYTLKWNSQAEMHMLKFVNQTR